ncbi:hypothetical protein AB5N19_11594 [Seiridium cardinale]
MPKKKQAKTGDEATDGSVTISAADVRLISAVFANAARYDWIQWNVNWQKTADDLNSSSIRSVRERFRAMSAKHGWFTAEGQAPQEAEATDAPMRVAKPRARRNRKKQPETTEETQEEHPSKRRRIEVKTETPTANYGHEYEYEFKEASTADYGHEDYGHEDYGHEDEDELIDAPDGSGGWGDPMIAQYFEDN